MRNLTGIVLSFLLCSSLSAQDSIHVSLAEWTFDNWYGGGVLPPNQTVDTPVPADRGTLAETALIGTEQMFSDGDVTRKWSVPTTGGYIRCATGWSSGTSERYYMMSGIHTQNASSVRLTSSHATSSSSQPYSLKVQFRLSSDGNWKDLFGPFSVTSVTQSGISKKQVNEILLPEECNNVSYLDIRWLCTSFPPSASTHFRLDNIFLTANIVNPEPDADKTTLINARELNENEWTIPSWTLLLSARKKAELAPLTSNLSALAEVMENMLPSEMPYTINTSYNGDPSENMGFAWYTNKGETEGHVQIVDKENATINDFSDPFIAINSTITELTDVNYVVAANDPTSTADLQVNSKRSYAANKARATGLTPGTKYSYRVGKEGAWSSIRNFRTAANTKDNFSFIYITDTQANSVDNFDVSANTLSEAYKIADDPSFLLITGDLVESQGSSNSEWEYEQFFERMQNIWSNLPLVATIGNHDASSSNNFFNHINNDNAYNQTAPVKTNMNGTVYSFVVSDALFMIVNHEDRTKPGYNESLGNWMREQVTAYPNVRWRIVGVHTGLFSGGSHHNDATIADLRDDLLPYYHELKIDLSLQGHDHVYNAIGTVDNLNKMVVPGAVKNVDSAPVVAQSNMNGKTGGTFDVTDGTFYFINNAASRKKYSPRTEQYMNSNASATRVPDYWSLFTGRFGQTGEPTFSIVSVTTDTVFIDTYAITNSDTTYLFDQIKITKQVATTTDKIINKQAHVVTECNDNRINVIGLEAQSLALFNLNGQLISIKENSNHISTVSLMQGIYILHVFSEEGVYKKKIIL